MEALTGGARVRHAAGPGSQEVKLVYLEIAQRQDFGKLVNIYPSRKHQRYLSELAYITFLEVVQIHNDFNQNFYPAGYMKFIKVNTTQLILICTTDN